MQGPPLRGSVASLNGNDKIVGVSGYYYVAMDCCYCYNSWITITSLDLLHKDSKLVLLVF